MFKLMLTVAATTLLLPVLAEAKQRELVEGCLKGTRQTQACYTMIANYWKHAPAIERAACQEGADPRLMKALIAYESTYNNRAVSPVSATGLTQVMPATAMGEYGLSRANLYHPETSVRAGSRYLGKMYKQFGRLDLALAAYNAGPGRVKKAGNRVPNIRETQVYVRNVMSLYAAFKEKDPSPQCRVAATAAENKPAALQAVANNQSVALPTASTINSRKQTKQQVQQVVNKPAQATNTRSSTSGLRASGSSFRSDTSSSFTRQTHGGHGIYSN